MADLQDECSQLCKILAQSIVTAKKNDKTRKTLMAFCILHFAFFILHFPLSPTFILASRSICPPPHPTPPPPTNLGRVTQIIGSTFDAEFPEHHLPAIYNAVKITSQQKGITLEPDRRGAAASRRRAGAMRRPGQHRRHGPRHGLPRHRRARSRCRSASARSAACSISPAT